MPLYEYECQKCGDRIEHIQKFSDALLKVHEGCGGKLRKLLSAPAIQFKGTGWYITDYARAGKSDSDSKSDGDSKKDAKKSEARAESASEAKSETKSASKSDSKSKGDSGSSSKSSSGSKD